LIPSQKSSAPLADQSVADRAAKKERHMLGTIIAAIVVGAIIGALGRLLLPGKQNISIVMTILIGIVANVIVTLIVRQLGYSNSSGGIAWIPLLLGAVVAAILIVVYGRMSHKSFNA
jgi:uncharacterized membrane protein YeaQ/YmgE (transglycosylase-associated protein family)